MRASRCRDDRDVMRIAWFLLGMRTGTTFFWQVEKRGFSDDRFYRDMKATAISRSQNPRQRLPST